MPADEDNIPLLQRELDKEFSLLNDRLFLNVPNGTEDAQMQQGVMYAPESNQRITRLMLEEGNQKLVVYAQEMFYYSSGDLQKDAKEFTKLMFGSETGKINTSIEKLNEEIDIIRATPAVDDLYDDSVLVDSVFIVNTDNTVIYLGVYVTDNLYSQQDLCKSKADEIINSIKLGTRKIGQDAHTANIRNDMTIDVDKDYTLVVQIGIDFDVYHVIELTEIGTEGNYFGIYFGFHPSTPADTIEKGDEGYEFAENTMLGAETPWVGTALDSDEYKWETLIALYDSYMKMHIFFYTSSDEQFNEIMNILETIKFVDN